MPDGKIRYVEIPAIDVETSARFYSDVFGWNVRTRGDGQRAFDDSTGAVSGSWILGRPPAGEPGMLMYVMVDSIDVSLRKIAGAGGRVRTASTPLGGGGEAFATFLEPAGNLVGVY